MLKIVVNADDFGLSLGTNTAIEEAHQKGILTSASLFANGPALNNALSILKRNSKLGVGVHLSLTIGKSILPKESVSLLVDQDGYFKNTFLSLLIDIRNKKFRDQVASEWDAQIQHLLKLGVDLDHINGQEHVQMNPSLFKIANSLRIKYKIPHIRISNDCLPYSPPFLFTHPTSIVNIIKFLLLKFFALIINHKSSLMFTGLYYTRAVSPDILIEAFHQLLKKNSDNIEILLHPAHFELGDTNFDYKRQNIYSFMKNPGREKELHALLNKDVAIEASKLNLVRFSDL